MTLDELLAAAARRGFCSITLTSYVQREILTITYADIGMEEWTSVGDAKTFALTYEWKAPKLCACVGVQC